MITCIVKEKDLTKINIHSWLKLSANLRIEENLLKLKNSIPKKPTAIIILNDFLKKHKAFLLRSKICQGYAISPLVFNIILEFLASTVRQEKEINVIQVVKEEVKLSLFEDDMTVYIKNWIQSTRGGKSY